MRVWLIFLILMGAMSFAHAASQSCPELSLCDCKKRVAPEYHADPHDDMTIPKMLMCEQKIQGAEAKNFKQDKTCSTSSHFCYFILKYVKKVGATEFVYHGAGIVATIKDQYKDGDIVRATVVDDRRRTFIFERVCAEGPCDAYDLVSGPDKKAKLGDGGYDAKGEAIYILRLQS